MSALIILAVCSLGLLVLFAGGFLYAIYHAPEIHEDYGPEPLEKQEDTK
jgi:hypothetical protein